MEKKDLLELGVGATENANAMVAYWDENLICRFANKAYVTWFGIKPEDMINVMHIRQVLGPMYDENLPRIKAALRGEEQNFERTIILPNGQSKKARANYYPDIANGKVKGFFVHVADITPITIGNDINGTAANGGSYYFAATEKVLKDVTETLKDHILSQFPGIPYLSKKHFISESKLKRDFKQKYDTTIFNYYRDLQMELAHQYITEKKYNKSQMAVLLNFSNPSNFSACYQKYLQENLAKHLMEKIKKEHADRYKIFIEQTPIAIAMVDTNLCFLAASKKWVSDYDLHDKVFIGECLYDVFPGSEIIYSDMLSACLKGDINKCDEGFIDTLDGRPAWMRWDIRPWYNDDGEIGGLSIFTEDITAQKLKEDEIVELSTILYKTYDIYRVGVWQRNFKTNTRIWSKSIREILEVPKDSEPPSLEMSLNFYKEGPGRELAQKLITNAVKNGTHFDFETEMITAKGKVIKARVIGYPEFVDGECFKISGILQELTNKAPDFGQHDIN
ncbi:MAG: PAS domain-containing protein [Bacteroidota bacterium]|nr:PAS domain-containing protein [Bacteroidota bacterium]